MNLLQAQEESFVRSYNSVACWNYKYDEWNGWEYADLVISYNYKGTNKVALFFDNDSPMLLHPVGSVEEDANTSGLNYQFMNYIDTTGEEIRLALFDNGVLIVGGDEYIFKFSPEE